MKKLIIYTFLLMLAAPAFAQKDAQAKAILNQISKNYRSFTTIKSDFIFTIDSKLQGIKQSQNGTLLTQAKTNKFKMTLYSAGSKTDVEQEIISNGKSQWTYLKKDKEVQVADAGSSNSDGFNPAQLFTMYEHGYKYVYAGDQKVSGKVYQVIDLTPEDIQKPIFKVRLIIDKVKKQIYSAQMFDKSGVQYNYTLQSFVTTAQAPDNAFIFDTKAHPGIEVVDLR